MKVVSMLLERFTSDSSTHMDILVIEGVTDVHEHCLASRRIGHLGLEAAVLLRLLLPSRRIAIVGCSAH